LVARGWNAGSPWLRWDPHLHAPGTLRNNQYPKDDPNKKPALTIERSFGSPRRFSFAGQDVKRLDNSRGVATALSCGAAPIPVKKLMPENRPMTRARHR
jgi:hypothetical protein